MSQDPDPEDSPCGDLAALGVPIASYALVAGGRREI